MNDIEKNSVASVNDPDNNEDRHEVLVSVIVPIYNAYDYLGVALDSILDQTLREIEVICVDDGSTDRSLDILKKYRETDPRIRVVTENNAGVSTARNKGIVRARGKYMMFLDADDFYEPTLIEKLYNLAEKKNLDIALARFDIYNNKTEKFTSAPLEVHGDIYAHDIVASKNEYPNYIFESTSGYVWNKLFRTSLIRGKEITFAPEIYIFEDIYFVCAALAYADRVARIDEVLIHHRIYSEQSRARLFKKYYSMVPDVYLKIKDFLTKNGSYIPLNISYLNLSASRCYKIYNILTGESKENFWDILHYGKADTLGWYKHGPDDFDDPEVYDFVANVGLYNHSQYMARVKRGKELNTDKLDVDNLNRKIKHVKQKEKIVEAGKGLLKKK